MKNIAWNVCSAKRRHMVAKLKALVVNYKPDILFIIEIITNNTNSERIVKTLGFDKFEIVSPINHSGGLSALWNNDQIHAATLSTDSRAIHLLVFDPTRQKNCIITGEYGPAQQGDKDPFWA